MKICHPKSFIKMTKDYGLMGNFALLGLRPYENEITLKFPSTIVGSAEIDKPITSPLISTRCFGRLKFPPASLIVQSSCFRL